MDETCGTHHLGSIEDRIKKAIVHLIYVLRFHEWWDQILQQKCEQRQ